MSRPYSLSAKTIDYLRWAWGISRAQWVAAYGYQGKWWGDRCGCPDDRCIGYHHDEHEECGCVDALAQDLLAKKDTPSASTVATLIA